MFGSGTQKNGLPLIIVCDDKNMVYANYLIQLIGQKDDAGDSIVGVEDDSVSAAIYTVKNYKDNLPQIPSTQHILFIGQTSVAKEQSKTIPDAFNKLGMHYGWLGKRAVLYVDDTTSDWMKLKDSTKKLGGGFVNMIMPVVVGAPKMLIDYNKTVNAVKAQQYKTLIKVFYEDGLKSFVEG